MAEDAARELPSPPLEDATPSGSRKRELEAGEGRRWLSKEERPPARGSKLGAP